MQQLMALLGGHPYLTRQAMYRVACGDYSADELIANAADDRGPFGDHLRRHLARFAEQPRLAETMQEIIKHQTCSDEKLFMRLNGAGLAVRRSGALEPRCRLYGIYFGERLGGD
jgi:hypothetical protein